MSEQFDLSTLDAAEVGQGEFGEALGALLDGGRGVSRQSVNSWVKARTEPHPLIAPALRRGLAALRRALDDGRLPREMARIQGYPKEARVAKLKQILSAE